MKGFKVNVVRKVEETADLTIEATSPNKAKAIAEYEANRLGKEINWMRIEPDNPVRIKSTIIGEESTEK